MGSIYHRASDDRWVASVSFGTRRRRTRLVRYAATYKAAEAELVELRKLVPAGSGSGRLTVGQYLRSWLDGAGQRSLKASTLRTYEAAAKHIERSIGNISLTRLTAEDVEGMLDALPLEPKGQRNVLGVLSRVLETAVRRGYVLRNAARLVEPPRVVRVEPDALTVEQAKRIIAAVRGDRLEALWVLALTTGMRQAELLGLRWADVDLEAGTLRVVYALVRDAEGYALDEPKTRRSRRTIALPALAVAALRRHEVRQAEERLGLGIPTEKGLVFVTEPGHPSRVDPEGLGGRPLNGGWVSHRWPHFARNAGVDVTMHGLRHAQSTLLVALAVHPRVIAGRLGHATIAETMDRYAHVAEPTDREAADALERALG